MKGFATILQELTGDRAPDHVVGHSVVLNTGCEQLERDLRDRGYTPHATPLDEFIKAGGSAKCLTLRLDGEEAAIWPEPSSPATD